jgi:hypothetical protein
MCANNKDANLKRLLNLLWSIYKDKFMINYIKNRNLINLNWLMYI